MRFLGSTSFLEVVSIFLTLVGSFDFNISPKARAHHIKRQKEHDFEHFIFLNHVLFYYLTIYIHANFSYFLHFFSYDTSFIFLRY